MIATTSSLGALAVAVVALAIFVQVALETPLKKWHISSATFFIVVGLLVTNGPWALFHVHLHSSFVREVAELALAIVLFSDAATVSFTRLRHDIATPLRLLGIGFPLTIVLGALIGVAVFGTSAMGVVILVAVIVSPTDAALGAAVVEDERVPARIRRALNVESGLNDGLATPVFTLVLAKVAIDAASEHVTITSVVLEVIEGFAIGAGVGVLAGLVLRHASRHQFTTKAGESIAMLATALGSYGAALAAGANGFVAAFTAGLCFGAAMRIDRSPQREEEIELSGDLGRVVSALVWMLFGAMVVPGANAITWRSVVFAVLALTIIRMLPVWLSLLGSHLSAKAVLFMGWFGPRGLASVVFALLAYDQLPAHDGSFVLSSVVCVVVLSVLAHGVSADPLISRLAKSERSPGDVATPH